MHWIFMYICNTFHIICLLYPIIYKDIAHIIKSSNIIHFDIEADDDDEINNNSTLWLHLDKIASAITPNTKYKFHPSRGVPPRKNVINNLSILASDTSKSNEDFTVLSVNSRTGGVNGLQRLAHGGIIRQISTSDIGGVSQGVVVVFHLYIPKQFLKNQIESLHAV